MVVGGQWWLVMLHGGLQRLMKVSGGELSFMVSVSTNLARLSINFHGSWFSFMVKSLMPFQPGFPIKWLINIPMSWLVNIAPSPMSHDWSVTSIHQPVRSIARCSGYQRVGSAGYRWNDATRKGECQWIFRETHDFLRVTSWLIVVSMVNYLVGVWWCLNNK